MTHTTPALETHRITAIILAAGASSRMGAHKLLLPLAGRSVAAWAVSAACASQAAAVLIVLGRDADAVRESLANERYQTVINDAYARGQGTSLALAVSALASDTPGALILLADQPFMTADAINRVLASAEQAPDRIVMGVANARAGHPVYLPHRLFGDLIALTGDSGARDIIARERAHVLEAPLENDLAHLDVDTSEDYERACALAYRLVTSPD